MAVAMRMVTRATVLGLLLAWAAPAWAWDAHEVQFRLEKWKTLHFDDAGKADKHFKAVKDLGCDVKKADHNGHTDVSYRCPKWKVMKTKTDEEAHVWQKWLNSVGFQTKHTH